MLLLNRNRNVCHRVILRFCLFPLFSYLFFRQILMNAKPPGKCDVHARCNNTHGSYVCTCNLDILEMERIVHVQSIVSEAIRYLITIIRNSYLVCFFVGLL